jgi:hypothetical protein
MAETDDKPKDETPPPQQPEWQKREFGINTQMKTVIRAAIPATEAQIALLKRKLKKIQYGS